MDGWPEEVIQPVPMVVEKTKVQAVSTGREVLLEMLSPVRIMGTMGWISPTVTEGTTTPCSPERGF